MKRIIFWGLAFFLIVAVSGALQSQVRYSADWQSIDSRPIPGWFTDAKFGIFIHWGLYSVPAWGPTEGNVYDKYAEWYWSRQNPDGKPSKAFTEFHNKTFGEKFRYQDFVSGFKAEMFEPDQWADVFAQSGAKYIVLTSKHHEGFALWPSQHSWNWNSFDVGPHRDLAGDLTKAVKAKGLHMGFYYSLYEWFNPLYKKDPGRYVDEHMLPQMKDLVNRYLPDIVWTDGEWDMPSEKWKSAEFLAWLYNDSPVKESVVVNDRWGKETRGKHGGYYTSEYDLMHSENLAGKQIAHPWEECRGIGGSFGYNRNENLKDYQSSGELIRILIDKVARGGNLLLNIGPTADGRIPVIMQQRLFDMGEWLRVNGEGIYGTKTWDQAPGIDKNTQIFYTVKGNDLFVIVTQWQDKPWVVTGAVKPKSVSMLGYNGKVKFSVSGNRVTIAPPPITPATSPCQHAWVFKLAGAVK